MVEKVIELLREDFEYINGKNFTEEGFELTLRMFAEEIMATVEGNICELIWEG